MTIKTYRYNAAMNTVSHILTGKGGNSMRYNFERGNAAMGKAPELTLRGQYAQELLESHELFKNGTISLVKTIRTDDPVEEPIVASQVSKIEQVTSPDELLVYMNTNTQKKFTDPKKALAYAAKEGWVFPNLEIG